MSTDDIPQLTTVSNSDGAVFVYDGAPSRGSLIAAHCPAAPATDPFGVKCPQGDWCQPGYQLIRMVEPWPGTLLRRAR